MIRFYIVVFAATLLAACARSPEAAAPQPSAALAAMFPDCQWGEVRAAGVSVWSFACANDRLIADEALPGFVRERTAPDGEVRRDPAIQFFAKDPAAPLDSVIDAVRAASPGAETCALEAGADGVFQLVPTGEAASAYQAFVEGRAEGPSLPCGPLGPSEAGQRTFQQVEGAPDKVAMIDWGSDPAIFDAGTLRASP